MDAMNYKKHLIAGSGLGGAVAAVAGGLSVQYVVGRWRAQRAWSAQDYGPLADVGAVKDLTILPLVDWYTASDDLAGEPGVAYLVRADDTTILFDVGFNFHGEHPSPLLRNMEALGVKFSDLDAIVISHPHVDHLGGLSTQIRRRISPSAKPVDLGGVTAYVPSPLSNPTADIIVSREPRVIAPGVAVTGVIPRQLFLIGWSPEQSIAVNVKGKGVVVIIGCGHPTLQRIIERAETLFDEPLYGVVGGLHYPVTSGRGEKIASFIMRYMGTGKWPWDPVNKQEVEDAIAFLSRRNPGLVALSPHDSCDWSIEEFHGAFRDAYQYILVGREITVTGT